ncbi:POTRA domain-containing protein, partial [Arthrospira platensis SPKY1]|nr:POTRA domain-containing protein [Arthrospira platensis SPKY1]
LSELEALATLITRNYRANGYFVARAYIPQQEVVDGIITIRVVEGNYGQFHLTNESLVKDSIVQAMLDDVKGYDIVSLDTLERAMLIINDTPGVQVVRARS